MTAVSYEILLIGNHRPDQQMSMLRYYDMLLRELRARDIPVNSIEPGVWIGGISAGPLTKWLRYIDKYLFFPWVLKRTIAQRQRAAEQAGRRLVIHITDHSNAPYRSSASGPKVIATCHDLLAVRGALGEDTDCQASGFGKILQAKILANLRKMDLVICVSGATQADLARLAAETESRSIPLPLNQPFSILPDAEVDRKLAAFQLLKEPYILHVGSSLKRKNREGILRIFAQIADRFTGKLVFAGEKLSPEQRDLAAELRLENRILEIINPSGEVIEALYNRAFAFLFPSKTEGFGWPIIEAQACGCPVLAARTTSLPEVMGEGGLLRELNDETGFATDLLRLQDDNFRQEIIQKGLVNLERFSTKKIIDQYLAAYSSLVADN